MTSQSPLRTEWEYIIRTLKILVITMGSLFLFRVFIIDFSVVEQSSMEPTLHQDDVILIDKLSSFFTDLHRGDIVQIFNPADNTILVKRIIGLPGEAVSSLNGEIYIVHSDGTTEKLKESNLIPDQHMFTSRGLNEHEYYVLGDNRRGSIDSRVFGPISRAHIIGRIMAVWRKNNQP